VFQRVLKHVQRRRCGRKTSNMEMEVRSGSATVVFEVGRGGGSTALMERQRRRAGARGSEREVVYGCVPVCVFESVLQCALQCVLQCVLL